MFPEIGSSKRPELTSYDLPALVAVRMRLCDLPWPWLGFLEPCVLEIRGARCKMAPRRQICRRVNGGYPVGLIPLKIARRQQSASLIRPKRIGGICDQWALARNQVPASLVREWAV